MERLPRRTPQGDVNLLGMVFDALATAVEDIPIIRDIVAFIASLFGNSSASNARIARLETIVSKGSSGFDDFNRADTSVLGRGPAMTADWVQGGDGQSLGVRGRAAGLVEAVLPDDGRRWARYPVPASSSTMTADTIVDDKKVDNRACTSVIVAANAAFTEFVYANVFGTGVYLGRGTRSGDVWSFSDWKQNPSYKVGTAERVEVRASGSGIYQLVVDNTVILEHTDVSYPIDAEHRYVGFAVQCWTALLAIPAYGWRLSAFSLKSEAGTFTAIESVETIANGAVTVANGAQTTAENAVGTAVTEATAAATTVAGTVQTNLDNAVSTLNNRIDTVATGGNSAVRSSFFTDGTWTKPVGYSRHVVKIIGGASGGGRKNGLFDPTPEVSEGGKGEGSGGFAGGCNEFEFFDSDLPATVSCTIGLGGIGATSDSQAGAAGGQSDFGTFGGAGGGLSNAFGFGEKTRALRGGTGGFTTNFGDIAARAGTGHGYANGGAGGTPNNSGNAGSNGNRPTPNTLADYGTGGGGGARKGGTGNGGRGGDGAVPGGPGGGGGAYNTFGFAGNGGNGGDGAIFITSYK